MPCYAKKDVLLLQGDFKIKEASNTASGKIHLGQSKKQSKNIRAQ